jgi:gluconolactonase
MACGRRFRYSLETMTLKTSRRTFVVAAGSAFAAALARAQQRDWSGQSPVRYPDPDVVSLDERFDRYRVGNTPIQRLHVGTLWAEGPAWNGVGRYLVWSDIPNDLQLRWIEEDGHVSVFRRPSGNSNGNTFDHQGRQLSCEHAGRRVVRYEHDGSVSVLAAEFEGKPFNAPNDVVVHPDGDVWFTDPGYGSLADYEGNKGPLQLKEAVYRIDGATGRIEKATDEIYKPNGLCFSPDYKKLYVADTGATHYPEAERVIKVWDVDGTRLASGRTFTSMALDGFDQAGLADGIRCDTDGNIWSSAGWVGAGYDGVHVFAPNGDRIGQIRLPEICANLCFGGRKRNRLFMAASQSLYAVYTEAQGAHIA